MTIYSVIGEGRVKQRSRIVDATMFNDEWKLLELRIAWMQAMNKNIRHVIAESNYSFSGIKKEYSLKNHIKDSPFVGLVEVLQIDLENIDGHWEREFRTRELLLAHVKKKYHPCLIIFSDLDELPSKSQVEIFENRNVIRPNQEFDFRMNTYLRKVNWYFPRCSPWDVGQFLISNTPVHSNGGRLARLNGTSVDIELIWENPGYHITYCFDKEKEILNKVKSFADFQIYTSVLPWFSAILNFANQYYIDHMGNMTRRGFGLLIPQSKNNEFMEFASRIVPNLIERKKRTRSLVSRIWASARLSALYDGTRCFFLSRDNNRAQIFGDYYFGTLKSVSTKQKILFFLIHIHQIAAGIRQAIRRIKTRLKK